MSEPETNIHVLDAAYRPFPPFADWAARTSVDTVRWDRYLGSLKDKSGISGEALKRAYEVVKRAAAVDTGAIEGLYEADRGFTFTVAFETSAWEVEFAKKGENARPLFEAQLHAYDYVLDLATKSVPISEVAIRTLHEVVCQAQDTYRVQTPPFGFQEQKLPKGAYKLQSNHVYTRDGSYHSYAPADVTPIEMARFVNELRSEAFLAAHPVVQAAYAHYGLVVIHPFADGNGRVARALASVFTYRAISMPVMILTEHKGAYLDALEVADGGEYQPFVDFMLSRSLDTIRVVNESVLVSVLPTVDDGVAAIDSLFTTRGGYTQEQVDGSGSKLMELVKTELTRILAEKTGKNFRGHAGPLVTTGQRVMLDLTHRLPASDDQRLTLLHVELSTSPPAYARVYRNYAISLPRDAAGDDDIELVRAFDDNGRLGTQIGFPTRAEKAFSARMDELVPSPSGVLQISARFFAERVVGEMLAELRTLAEQNLRGQL